MQPPPLGLYIHLPWCERKCPYCDFNSHEPDISRAAVHRMPCWQTCGRPATVAGAHHRHPVHRRRHAQPVLSASHRALLGGIAPWCQLSPPGSHHGGQPRQRRGGQVRGFREAGITRLSLGIQSFDDRLLQAWARTQQRPGPRRYRHARGRLRQLQYRPDARSARPGRWPAPADLHTRTGASPRTCPGTS